VTIAVVTIDAKTFLPTRVDSDVALAAAGDTAAFERVYRLHVPRIHGLVRRMLGPQEADEVTQDIFVRAWQKLGTFRGDSAFGTWLHRLGVNVIIERRRSWAILRARLDDDPEAIDLMAGPPMRVDVSLDLEQALETLPPGAREIFVLHDVEGYKHREISDLLDITTGTSKRQLHRARLLMRRHLSA
jgi:RNA polymerase sigma-70 factor, ECF subfamily